MKKVYKRLKILTLGVLLSLVGMDAFAHGLHQLAQQVGAFSHPLNAESASSKDILSSSNAGDWFQTESGEGQGNWEVSTSQVSVDAFNSRYALEGATQLSKQGIAYGAFEFQTTIHISELNNVQNPMVGIIPWFVDEDNYMYVQLKFTDMADYKVNPEEISDGYAIEKVLFSGKYDGESKYYTASAQQENTTFDSLAVPSLGTAKVAPTAAIGHTIKVRFENNSATATSYKVTISYNGVEIGSSYAYYYNSVAKNHSVGFMAQDVKAVFTNAVLNDFYAENNTAALARDWKESNGFTYRIQNGVDVWSFGQNNQISFITDPVKEGTKIVSNYRVTGSNIAGYDTNRGFTENPYKETDIGLPQNYELSATFKRDVTPDFSGTTIVQGYGLLAWYKDDMNFIDVTIRITTSGSKLSPTFDYEVVLFGWINGSSAPVGSNVYRMPNNFDPNVEHTLRVAKKSTGFYVYLDNQDDPILAKKVKGTSINYAYGYEGYNAQFTAGPISSRAIYEAYDEIAVLDNASHPWRVSAKTQQAWSFANSKVAIQAKESSATIGKRSYIIGASDISDRNMSVIVRADISLGSNGISELMLSPYLVDDGNFARIGLVWKNGKVYARVIASVLTEEDIDEGLDPKVVLHEYELSSVNLSSEITLRAQKVENVIALYINDTLVYGKQISGIDGVSQDYGVYVYNMDITMNEFATDGYKKWSQHQVGEWTTSGMKFNAWTVTQEGYLAGDATYESHMIKEDEDANRNFALKENPYHGDYDMTVDIKATAQSEAQDRVGVVMWYLDENNFMLFFMDMWRADSTVPRTTIYGKIDGQTLPTTYNHGGWLPEGDQTVEGGLTQTEASQVTNWHTIHVRKQGNTFTCSLDSGSGYISYTVAAGLPSTEGKTLYSGVYTYNDAVLIRSYDVTAVNGFTTPTLPCPPGDPYNEYVEPPALGNYEDVIFSDEFEEFESTEPGESSETSENSETSFPPVSSEPITSEPTEPSGGCFGSIEGVSSLAIFMLISTSALILRRRRMKIR